MDIREKDGTLVSRDYIVSVYRDLQCLEKVSVTITPGRSRGRASVRLLSRFGTMSQNLAAFRRELEAKWEERCLKKYGPGGLIFTTVKIKYAHQKPETKPNEGHVTYSPFNSCGEFIEE